MWTRDQIANLCWILGKAREFQKNLCSALLTIPKTLMVWITTKYRKLFKRLEYQTTFPASWDICIQVKKQQLEPDMEKWTGSKLGKEYVKAIYRYPAYLTYMQSTSCKMPGWMKHKLESRFQGEMPITSDTQMTLSSVQLSRSVMSNCLRPHESQPARPPFPSPTPRVHSNSCPSSCWWHLSISSSVIPCSSCPQIPPSIRVLSNESTLCVRWQSIGVSALASFPPKIAQSWSPLGWTGWTSLQSKGLSRVFSNTTVQKHQFFGAQFSSQSNTHIHTWPLEKP